MGLIDLTHILEHGMTFHRRLPAPLLRDYLTFKASLELYAEGTEFYIGRIDMVANTGRISTARSIATTTGRIYPSCCSRRSLGWMESSSVAKGQKSRGV
jgi:hypothetical protein